MKSHNKLPNKCPACNSPLTIAEAKCIECNANINSSFNMPALATLEEEEQEFF